MGDNPSAGYKEPRLDFQSNDPMSMSGGGATGNGRTTAKQNFVTDDQAAERYFIKKVTGCFSLEANYEI